ncbi:MAG: protein kinase [bacterium]|jgi:serine/threonine protein kinase
MATSLTDIITDPMHETTCVKCHHLLDISGLPTFTQIACPECGFAQGVPGKLGAFVLVELLGKGGMGAVYRGHDVGLNRWVAVKVMQSSFGGNPEFVETFRREAQAAAALNHPNIVQIYSFGVAHGQPYLVMELLEGGRLDNMIAKGEPLNEALILKIAADVAEGLNAAATIGLIHGDVKPENILMDSNGVAKVVDFGLAQFKAKAEGGTAKGIWGTPYYIAPEKLRGHPADARSDIYSLGGTMFHALALKPPFEGETPMDVVKARLKDPAPPLHHLRPDITHEVETIVSRMLEAEPQKRYPNYNSLLSDIRRVLAAIAPPVEHGPQITKKSGKFVMTKKKGGGTPAVMTASTSGAIAQSGIMEPLPEGQPKKSSHKLKIILWSVLGGVALLGAIGGGVAYHVAQTHKTQAAKDKAQVAKALKSIEQILKEFQPIAGDFSNRVIMAGIWSSNAQHLVSMVATGAAVLGDAAEWAGASSNAMVLSDSVTKFMTGTMVRASTEFNGMLDGVASQRVVVVTATNPGVAMAALYSVTNIPGRVVDLHKSVADEMAKISKGAEAIEPLIAKFSKVVKTAISDSTEAVRRAAEEKAARDKIEAERLAVEKVEAAKQAKIQADMSEIEAARKASVEFVQQHRFVQALNKVELATTGLQTPEGKAKGKQMVKAYKTLVELKTAIIDGIKASVKQNPETGYRFGWMGDRDILGADEAKIVTRDAQYTWETVSAAQMMRFIKYYIEKGDMGRYDQAQHFFAVALYIHEAFPGNEKAAAQGAKYLKDAIRARSTLDEMAKAILPDMASN